MGEREFGMTFKTVRLASGAPAFKRAKKAHTDHAKLMRLQKQVNALRPEVKMFEGSIVPTFPTNTTGSIDYISAVSQGSDNTNRIGDKISPKWIDIIVAITAGGTHSASSVDQVNFYLIKDLESNGVAPIVSGSAQSIFTSPNPVRATLNTNTRERFKIVKKWIFPYNELFSGNIPFIRQHRLNLSGVTFFHGAGSNNAAAGKNSYWMVALSTQPAVTTEVANYEYLFGFTDV